MDVRALNSSDPALHHVESAGGFGAIGVVALGVALGSYCLSAFVSIRLYEARDL